MSSLLRIVSDHVRALGIPPRSVRPCDIATSSSVTIEEAGGGIRALHIRTPATLAVVVEQSDGTLLCATFPIGTTDYNDQIDEREFSAQECDAAARYAIGKAGR